MKIDRKSKNPYAERLGEFSGHAWDQAEAERMPKGAWRRYFNERCGRDMERVILEVGCSNAEFLCAVAEKSPTAGLIGIDWKFKVLYKGARRAESEQIQNVALIRGLVQNAESFFAAEELDEIWIFFPDPWAKKSQLKNRIMNEPILSMLSRLLKPGGRIYFKTDHPGYYQWVQALLGLPIAEIAGYEPLKETQGGHAARGRRTRQVSVRRVMGSIEGDRPGASGTLSDLYEGTTLSSSGSSVFSGVKTLFEKIFEKEGLPVYALVLRKKETAKAPAAFTPPTPSLEREE